MDSDEIRDDGDLEIGDDGDDLASGKRGDPLDDDDTIDLDTAADDEEVEDEPYNDEEEM